MRTTHSDLSQLILDIADRLERVPAGYLVSDGGTLHNLRSAAKALVEQDQRIETLTVETRQLRYGK